MHYNCSTMNKITDSRENFR